LIIGGTGQVGRATALALAADRWRVVCAHRGHAPPDFAVEGIEFIHLDREEPGALERAVGAGVDALIDTIAYDEPHGRQLIGVQADVGAFVVISSASVYSDNAGRTLDEAAEHGFPRLPDPIGEDQPTVAPGPETYSTRKARLEATLLRDARRPVSILRPCAIHGPGSRAPREWFFVRRILDRRRRVPLAYGGESRFHTAATANIAELTRVVLRAPATQVLNIADPSAPTALEIGAMIAAFQGHEWRLVPFEGRPVGSVGAHPWCVPRPIIVDLSRAEALGYRAATTYRDAVGAACRSAEALAAAGVAFAPYLAAMFDYAAEDAWLAART
jgi:nucleoside-diphosphate-sugar epimerase